MQIVRQGDECPRPGAGAAVTIGAYDGVHRGHQAVIATVRRLAAERSLDTAVVTFDRHPAAVVRPESAPKLLTDLDQKLELLGATGVDHAVVVHFDAARSEESAEDFVREVLVDCLNAKLVVVGSDFHFGHGRKGNVALLTEMGADLGFDVLGLDLVGVDGRPTDDEAARVSSTAIRRWLTAGDLADANAALGRTHEVRGVVVHGEELGRRLGYPTANLEIPDDILLPADGIYAGWYDRPDGSSWPAALSLGRRPTVHDDQPFSLLEAHLLDFDGDLYGERAAVHFVGRIRGEERFDSLDALADQIALDCDAARSMLGEIVPPR